MLLFFVLTFVLDACVCFSKHYASGGDSNLQAGGNGGEETRGDILSPKDTLPFTSKDLIDDCKSQDASKKLSYETCIIDDRRSNEVVAVMLGQPVDDQFYLPIFLEKLSDARVSVIILRIDAFRQIQKTISSFTPNSVSVRPQGEDLKSFAQKYNQQSMIVQQFNSYYNLWLSIYMIFDYYGSAYAYVDLKGDSKLKEYRRALNAWKARFLEDIHTERVNGKDMAVMKPRPVHPSATKLDYLKFGNTQITYFFKEKTDVIVVFNLIFGNKTSWNTLVAKLNSPFAWVLISITEILSGYNIFEDQPDSWIMQIDDSAFKFVRFLSVQ